MPDKKHVSREKIMVLAILSEILQNMYNCQMFKTTYVILTVFQNKKNPHTVNTDSLDVCGYKLR